MLKSKLILNAVLAMIIAIMPFLGIGCCFESESDPPKPLTKQERSEQLTSRLSGLEADLARTDKELDDYLQHEPADFPTTSKPGYSRFPKDYLQNQITSLTKTRKSLIDQIASVKADITQLQTSSSESSTPTTGGSCPYLYAWNGTNYIRDNDIIPFRHPTLEDIDYYRMLQPLKPDQGYYNVRIAEELPETSYLDFIRLITVDHPADVDIYPDINGNIFNISNPKPPVSCIDSRGNDCLDMLKGREDGYTPGTYFDGRKGDYFIANFGDISGAKTIKLIMTTDTCGGQSILIDTAVQTQNSANEWQTHIVISTHEFWATNVFDITNLLPDANGEYKLRFYFTNSHKINYIAIDTTPEVEKEVHVIAPVYARTGEDVLSQVTEIDSSYLIMKQGDDLLLRFPYQPASNSSNSKRDFVFLSKGYYIRDQ